MKSTEILRAAADALDDHSDPFASSFLAEHEITFDQCMSLAEHLAIGARIVAAGIEKPRSLEGQAMLMIMAAQALAADVTL